MHLTALNFMEDVCRHCNTHHCTLLAYVPVEFESLDEESMVSDNNNARVQLRCIYVLQTLQESLEFAL